MQTFQNYVLGQWVSGEGEETEQINAITGEKIGTVSSAGIDFSAVLEYGRMVGGAPLRKMTFQERGRIAQSTCPVFIGAQRTILYHKRTDWSYKNRFLD